MLSGGAETFALTVALIAAKLCAMPFPASILSIAATYDIVPAGRFSLEVACVDQKPEDQCATLFVDAQYGSDAQDGCSRVTLLAVCPSAKRRSARPWSNLDPASR